MENTFTLEFSSTETEVKDSVWLNLVQDEVDSSWGYVTETDINNMLSRSMGGLTSFSYLVDLYANPVKEYANKITIDIDFFAFPHSLDMQYKLSINGGTITNKRSVSEEMSGTKAVPMTDTLSFDYLIAVDSLEWESDCYDEYGRVTSPPTYTVQYNKIIFSKKIFSVIRLKLRAIGFKYTATVVFDKDYDSIEYVRNNNRINRKTSTNKITNVNLTVIGEYENNGKTEYVELPLTLPEGVEAALESCPPESGITVKSTKCWMPGLDDYYTTAYYSTCTGEIIDDHTVEIKSCGEIYGTE